MNSQQQLTFSPVSAVTARALKVQLERAGGPAITLAQLRSQPCDCTVPYQETTFSFRLLVYVYLNYLSAELNNFIRCRDFFL